MAESNMWHPEFKLNDFTGGEVVRPSLLVPFRFVSSQSFLFSPSWSPTGETRRVSQNLKMILESLNEMILEVLHSSLGNFFGELRWMILKYQKFQNETCDQNDFETSKVY